MSREVMGSAFEGAAVPGTSRSSPEGPDPAYGLHLARTDEVGDDPASADGPSLGVQRIAALVVGSAVLAGVVAAGVTASVLQGGGEQAKVVAWIEFGDGSDYPGNDRVKMVLNVVNAGRDEVVVGDVDLDGGLEAGAPGSAVGLTLDRSVRVAPGAHARQDVLAEVEDCQNRRRPAEDDPGGTLRVSVTDADARSSWVLGSEVGAFPVTSSTLVQAVCDVGLTGPVQTTQTSVSADGELVMALRSTGHGEQDVEVRGPDGVRFLGVPSLPVTVPGEDEGTVTVAIRLVVDECTDEIEQLETTNQVRFVVGEQDLYDYDFLLVHSWYVREVTRVCG